MASDLQKTIAGGLLFGASALTGNALLMTAAGGVGVNWTSEGLVGLWRRTVLAHAPGTPLTRAARRALEEALTQVEAAYVQETGRPDPETFRELRGCLSALDGVFVTQPADLATAQRDLLVGLGVLLEDRSALPFVRAHLLPAAARTFRAVLADDAEAWRLYHGWLIERLATQMATQAERAEQVLTRTETVLAEIAAQERALAALHASAQRLSELAAAATAPAADTVTYENRDLNVGGKLVQSAGDTVLGDAPRLPAESQRSRPARNVQFRNDNVTVKGDTYQTAGDFVRGARAEVRTDLPEACVLTLQLTPTPAGARVRWRADGIEERNSEFSSPYRGLTLATVLRALESQQHPDFALAPSDLDQLHALGLLGAGGVVPDDLPRRVGRVLHDALFSGQGIAALALARRQATTQRRPLALRLLLPPDDVELAALPWELLWPPQGLPLLLSATPSLLLTRHLDLADPLPPAAARRGRPLRILALSPRAGRGNGAQDEDALTSGLSQLWAELRAGGAEVVEVSPATREDLARATQLQPDIVQFTGHGWYTDSRGVLFFDPARPDATADLVDADQVAAALRGTRMVVLAACRGAQSAGIEGGAASLLTGVAPALSAAGVPAVIGMQLAVRTEAALRASRAIYSALAAGLSAQAVVGRARDELYVVEPERSSWYVPVLYVRTSEGGPVYV